MGVSVSVVRGGCPFPSPFPSPPPAFLSSSFPSANSSAEGSTQIREVLFHGPLRMPEFSGVCGTEARGRLTVRKGAVVHGALENQSLRTGPARSHLQSSPCLQNHGASGLLGVSPPPQTLPGPPPPSSPALAIAVASPRGSLLPPWAPQSLLHGQREEPLELGQTVLFLCPEPSQGPGLLRGPARSYRAWHEGPHHRSEGLPPLLYPLYSDLSPPPLMRSACLPAAFPAQPLGTGSPETPTRGSVCLHPLRPLSGRSTSEGLLTRKLPCPLRRSAPGGAGSRGCVLVPGTGLACSMQ